MEALVNIISSTFSSLGYLGVVFLMAIESSFFPLPSEIVIPPVAYLAATGSFNILVVILCGTIGSVLGAAFNYALGYYLGRPLIYRLAEKRWARFFLVTPEKVKRAEDMFVKNGRSATFIGRLFPVVRHLISIPAGFSKMNFWSFILYTFLGSFVWVSILAALGYFWGANAEALKEHYRLIFRILIISCSLAVIYILYRQIKQKNKKRSD